MGLPEFGVLVFGFGCRRGLFARRADLQHGVGLHLLGDALLELQGGEHEYFERLDLLGREYLLLAEFVAKG
jgi:hypothetical protein